MLEVGFIQILLTNLGLIGTKAIFLLPYVGQDPIQVRGHLGVDSRDREDGALFWAVGDDTYQEVSGGAVHREGGHERTPRVPPAGVLADDGSGTELLHRQLGATVVSEAAQVCLDYRYLQRLENLTRFLSCWKRVC